MRRLAALGLAAFALGGCTTGSVDDVEPGETAVELQVEGYLRALADDQPARACSKLTEHYRRTIAPDCEELASELAAEKPFTFEGQHVDAGSIDELRWSIDVSGGNATVVGQKGVTTFKLRKQAGEGWQIDSIEPAPG